MAYDLIVRGGTVVDGSGMPRFRADVGVRDGRIVEIGRISERGATELDAEGHYVAPGFIDCHTHLDAQVSWDPVGPAAWHGVTSALMGNCGFSMAPAREAEKGLVLGAFERAEDIPRRILDGVPWQWETYADYLDFLGGVDKAINYGGMVGHTALRTYAMGERAYDQEHASPEDLDAMRGELRSAMLAGALGLSTSRAAFHLTSDGRLVPSARADIGELESLVDVLREVDAGSFQLAWGEYEWSRENSLERLRWCSDLAVSSGRPVVASVDGRGQDPIDFYESTSARGGRLFGFCLPATFDSMIGFSGNLPYDRLPVWTELRTLPLSEQLTWLRDPDRRRALIDSALTNEAGPSVGAEAKPPIWERLLILGAGVGPFPTVADEAVRRGCTPIEAFLDLSVESELTQLFSQPLGDAGLRDDFIRKVASPNTLWGPSDAGAHTAQVVAYHAPTIILGRWVRQEQVLTWEQAVKWLTFDVAWMWELPDRGLVREGFKADLTIFDPETVAPAAPSVAADLPGGAKRLKQQAIGMRSVVVAGVEVLRDGEHTGALPGEVLLGGAARVRA